MSQLTGTMALKIIYGIDLIPNELKIAVFSKDSGFFAMNPDEEVDFCIAFKEAFANNFTEKLLSK